MILKPTASNQQGKKLKRKPAGISVRFTQYRACAVVHTDYIATENCAAVGYYVTNCGNFSPTFRYNISVRQYHCLLRNNAEDRAQMCDKATMAEINFIQPKTRPIGTWNTAFNDKTHHRGQTAQ